jgi:hypothetical protein
MREYTESNNFDFVSHPTEVRAQQYDCASNYYKILDRTTCFLKRTRCCAEDFSEQGDIIGERVQEFWDTHPLKTHLPITMDL